MLLLRYLCTVRIHCSANSKTISVLKSAVLGDFRGGAGTFILNPTALDLLGTDAGLSFINQVGERINETAVRVFLHEAHHAITGSNENTLVANIDAFYHGYFPGTNPDTLGPGTMFENSLFVNQRLDYANTFGGDVEKASISDPNIPVADRIIQRVYDFRAETKSFTNGQEIDRVWVQLIESGWLA